MAEHKLFFVWRCRLVFFLVSCLTIAVKILPLEFGLGFRAGPDLCLLLAAIWIMRAPRLMPIWLLGSVMLLADIFLMRPPGLWAALSVLLCEALRARRNLLMNSGFLVEWIGFALALSAMTGAYAVILFLFQVPQPALGVTVSGVAATLVFYPVAVLLGARALGILKPGDGGIYSAGPS